MFRGLPALHRAALAAGLGLVAVVVGTWSSTLVGDPTPAPWGLALGAAAGAALVVGVLRAREDGPARVSRSRGDAPGRR